MAGGAVIQHSERIQLMLEDVRKRLQEIYDEGLRLKIEPLEDITRVNVKILGNEVVVDLYDDEGPNMTWYFHEENGVVYDSDGDKPDMTSIETFFGIEIDKVVVVLTEEEARILDEYAFKKSCKLKDSGLEDAVCYRALMSSHNKLRKSLKELYTSQWRDIYKPFVKDNED